MSRLQKKCFLASTGVHLLLVLILFVGPGFLARPPKAENAPELNFIPSMLVDAAVQNPGERSSGTPRPTPTPPAPAPAPRAEPSRQAETARPEPSHRDAVELSEHSPKVPKVSTELVSRARSNQPTKRSSSPSDSSEQQAANANRQARAALSEALRDLRDGGSGGKAVDVSGIGSGIGPSYASYGAWVRKVFEDAWVEPDGATGREPVTEVSVTVGPDGRIISSRIEKHSGDSRMDASVQRVLDRVSNVGRPFPEGADQKPRTYVIPFRLKNTQF